MSWFWKLILIGSILLNIFAIWGFLHYIMYGGNPLLELKRKLTGTSKAEPETIPHAEENARMKAEALEGKRDSLRVVFFGASITNGWDLDKYFTNFHPVNRGVGGFFPDLLVKYQSNVLDLKPKAVTFKLCSINIRPGFPSYQLKDAVRMMVQLAQENDIVPIVGTMIPTAKSASTIGDFNVADSLNSFNDWVRQYTSENNIAMIDYAKAIEDDNRFLPRDCSIDPIHVNDNGYDKLATAARPVIEKVLGLN